MLDRLQSLRERFDSEIATAADAAALFRLRSVYLSRKGGHLSLLLRSLKDVDPVQRPAVGHSLNTLKQYLEERLAPPTWHKVVAYAGLALALVAAVAITWATEGARASTEVAPAPAAG